MLFNLSVNNAFFQKKKNVSNVDSKRKVNTYKSMFLNLSVSNVSPQPKKRNKKKRCYSDVIKFI